MTKKTMIRVESITKSYFGRNAVDSLSFQACEGEIVGLLGPNGAGKSTTMKILTSYLMPTTGDAFIGDHSVVTDSFRTRQQIGYLPESSPTYKEMTVEEVLYFVASVRQIPHGQITQRVTQTLEQTFLQSVKKQTIETLSKGYRQRVGLAQALIHNPGVLILDEPTDGLDPNQKFIVRNLIREMGKSKTILLSTHILEEMEELCDRVVIISEGKLKADKPSNELAKMANNYLALDVSFQQPISAEQSEQWNQVPEIKNWEAGKSENLFSFYPKTETELIPIILDWAKQNAVKIVHLENQKPRVDQVFRQLTKTNSAEV